jgi:hypothetical protein
MDQLLIKLKTTVKEKLNADHTLSGTYRGKLLAALDAAIKEVFGKKQ